MRCSPPYANRPSIAEASDVPELPEVQAHAERLTTLFAGRELVISGVSNGYLALYRYDAVADVAYVLAIGSQRELRYRQ